MCWLITWLKKTKVRDELQKKIAENCLDQLNWKARKWFISAETLLLSNSLKHLTSNPYVQRNKAFRRVRTPHPKYFTQARNQRGVAGVKQPRQNFAPLEKCVGHSLKTLDTFQKIWTLLSTRGRNRVISSWPKFSSHVTLLGAISSYNHFSTPEGISWERPWPERIFVQIVKFPPSVLNESANKNPLLHSSLLIVHVVKNRKKNVFRRWVCNQSSCQVSRSYPICCMAQSIPWIK